MKSERIKKYEQKYMADYGFEKAMVKSRQKYIISLINDLRPAKVVEIGCGHDLLFKHIEDYSFFEQWVIIEPSERFSVNARNQLKAFEGLTVVQAFIEDVASTLCDDADLVICSGMLHEVKSPDSILHAAYQLMGSSAMLHINVPNAYSFHRRLARVMGLIEHEVEFSDRNKQLMQYNVFSSDGLTHLLTKAGFEVLETGGYLIKPFTHAQMESIDFLLTDEILQGLWQLGRELPELASEIYINARKEK